MKNPESEIQEEEQRFREVTLRRKRYGIETAEDDDVAAMMSRARYDEYRDEIRRRTIHRLTADIFAVDHPDRTYSYPASAWQYIKQYYAPKWFLKRWPVIKHTIRVSLSECYPNFAPSIPNEHHVVKLLVSVSTGQAANVRQ